MNRMFTAIVVLMVMLTCGTTTFAQTIPLDQYGGDSGLQVPGGATGQFRIAPLGNRWVFATPSGNAFWLRSVYGITDYDGGQSYHDAIYQKYTPKNDPNWNTSWFPWTQFTSQAIKRMRTWGFNSVGEYSANYSWPDRNPDKAPMLFNLAAANYGLRYGGVKDVLAGLGSAYTGWRGGSFPDVFDPKFVAYVAYQVADTDHHFTSTTFLAQSPWVIGITTDDADWTFGLKNAWQVHLGWVAATTAPTQTSNSKQGATYSDTTTYTKTAFRDMLRNKYGSLAALNAAWGPSYTTWDSNGGWPGGSGVLDESGQHSWLGSDHIRLSDVSATVKADLDAMLGQVASKYFQSYADAIHAANPQRLVFTPAAMGPPIDPPVLDAMKRYVDAIQVNMPRQASEVDQIKQIYEGARKPLFLWTNFSGQADSPLSSTPPMDTRTDSSSQGARGTAYQTFMQQMMDLTGSDGMHFVIGIDWWAWTDKVVGGEGTNFGLVSNKDNAYDGREDVMAGGTDTWGYLTGGESRNYGSFLGAVQQANQSVMSQLRTSEIGRAHV